MRHHSQPVEREELLAASRRSVGKAQAPAMTLNRMYHWVPRIISGVSQIFGLSRKRTMKTTTSGNSRLAGNAAFRPPFRDDFARHSGMISPGVTGQH